MKEKTYFGLTVYGEDEKYVLQSDIEKLPFYTFWVESNKGKTCLLTSDDIGIYLHDWKVFCELFIETGQHRFIG